MVEAACENGQTVEDLETIATKLDVWRYLKEDGWQIGRSQFYEHCKDGLLRPERDTGRYTLQAIDKYAGLHLKRVATGTKVNDRLEKMQTEKVETELEREKVRLERERHELGVKKKKFVPRDDFELAVIGRAVAMLAHLKHMVHTEATNYIEMVNGDQALAPELVATLVEDIEQHLATFARDVEFDVILEAE